jgi:hypothetical protein
MDPQPSNPDWSSVPEIKIRKHKKDNQPLAIGIPNMDKYKANLEYLAYSYLELIKEDIIKGSSVIEKKIDNIFDQTLEKFKKNN